MSPPTALEFTSLLTRVEVVHFRHVDQPDFTAWDRLSDLSRVVKVTQRSNGGCKTVVMSESRPARLNEPTLLSPDFGKNRGM